MCFVAGATGVIGRQLVPELVEAGHAVVGSTRSNGNAGPGRMSLDAEGRLFNVFALDIAADGTVQTVRSIVNPDKLGHLGRLVPRAAPAHGYEHSHTSR